MKKYYFKCPKCSNDSEFRQVHQPSRSYLEFSYIWPSLVGKPSSVQCVKCNCIFGMPGIPISAISKLTATTLGILIFSVFYILLTVMIPDLLFNLAENTNIKIIVEFVAENPKAVTIGILLFVSLHCLVTIISSIVSEYNFRKSFKNKYLTNPK